MSNCLTRLPNSRGCKTTLWGRDCPSQQRGDWRGRVSFITAEYLNDDRRTALIMTPKRPPSPPLPPCLAVPAWSEGTSPIIRCTIPGVGQKDSQSGPERKSLTQEYLQTHYPKESWTHVYTDGSAENAARNRGTGVYLGGKEDKISIATGLYTPQTIKLKQKPWEQQQPMLMSALIPLPMLSSVRMPCPSCRLFSQTGTLNSTTCLLLLSRFVEAMQSPCNGFPPIATCLETRLLILSQRKAQQRSKWIGPLANLRWRPTSRPSNTASGGTSTHSITRLTPTTC